MNTSTSSAAGELRRTPEPLLVRLARSAALVGLVFILALLIGLALLSSSTLLSDSIRPIFSWADVQEKPYAGWLVLAGIVLIPIALLVLTWRLKLRSWWWIGGGYLAVTPVLVYLAIDDPAVIHATRIEEIAPSFAGAESSYVVLMQYSKQAPSEEAKAFAKWKQRIVGVPVFPDKRDEWFAYLQKNRPALEADWADLAPQRRWLAELNAFDRFGDLGEATHSADIISFQVWRLLAQRSMHIAGLHELDGKPDEAIATLLPILQAARKLQPSARSLVRFMVGIVVERITTLYAIQVLERTRVSPEMKARLAAVLVGGVRGEAGARRLIGIENAYLLNPAFELPLGEWMAEITRGAAASPRRS